MPEGRSIGIRALDSTYTLSLYHDVPLVNTVPLYQYPRVTALVLPGDFDGLNGISKTPIRIALSLYVMVTA